MNDKPFTPEEYRNIYSKVPRLAVGLAVRMEDGIPLVLRKLPSWHNQWTFPGGTLLYQESPKDAAKRIAQGELGLSVEVNDFLGFVEYPTEEKEVGFGHTILLVFSCKSVGGELRPDEDSYEVKLFQELPETMLKEEKEFLNKINFKI